MTKEDFEKRLDELSKLEKGWLDGQGEVISSTAITTVIYLVRRLVEFGMKYPYVFPTEEGGVQLEWDDDHADGINICIDPDGIAEIFY